MQTFETKRGELTIRGHIHPGGSHAMILSHGFMANDESVQHYARLINQLGYTAITYDFCGGCVSGRSDGRQQDMTVFTECEDLRAVIAYAQERYAWISLLGCSQGGFVSALTAADPVLNIHSLILLYPALCIPDDARAGSMMFARFDPQNIPEVIPCGPMLLGRGYPQSVLKVDAMRAIAGYHGPVLLLHGTSDPVVKIAYANEASTVYTDCRYIRIDGGLHGFTGEAEETACAELKRFAMEHIDA